ncbi:MAG: Gfo/Idh/MocA family oxidoreductase [Ferruginibacter sp.]
MEKKINFAVVGMGYIGKRHAEIILQHPRTNLAAICDIKDPSTLGLENTAAPFFGSVDALLSSGIETDVVCIATPNGLHAPQALLALDAGNHVLIEKPLALSKADCEQIIAKANQKGSKVFCVMQNRFSPPAVWLKETVSSGILGKIFMVQVNCYWNRDDRYYKPAGWKGTADLDGGTLFTQFSHFIDILSLLFGDIKNIKATFRDFNHSHSTEFEDSGVIHFDFVNGGMGSINYSTAVWDKNLESSITVVAENGSVKIGGQYMNEVEYCHIKDHKMPVLAGTNPANDYGHYRGSADNHGKVFENLINVLDGKEAIQTNAEGAMMVVDIIERIYKLKVQP